MSENEGNEMPFDGPVYGDKMTVKAVDIRADASWSGFPKCVPNSDAKDAIYQPMEGWGVLETELKDTSKSNGSYSVSVIAGGGKFISLRDLKYAYNYAIEVALKKGNQGASGKLKEEYEEHRKELVKFEANKNTVHAHAYAKAHGGCFDQKRGWMEFKVYATLIYIGGASSSDLIDNLLRKHDLEDTSISQNLPPE